MPPLTADCVRNAFLEIAGAGDDSRMEESILLRQGAFCGRHLKLPGFGLLWFQEERQIKLYDAQRQVLFSGSDSDFVAQRPFQYQMRRAA